MILNLTKLPSKILRVETPDNLQFPLAKPYARLFRNMLDTVKSANGVGLAAPQVGKSLNLALIFLEEMDLPPFFIINPKIVKFSKNTEVIEEGCLSIPGVYGNVRRPKKITLEAYNLNGEKFSITDDTFLARVIQHEVDHLNGTLICDKFEKITQGKHLLPKFGLQEINT